MPSLVLLKRAEGAEYREKGCVNREAEGEADGCWVPGSSEGTCLRAEGAWMDSCPPELQRGNPGHFKPVSLQSSGIATAGFCYILCLQTELLSVQWARWLVGEASLVRLLRCQLLPGASGHESMPVLGWKVRSPLPSG